jgi:predicted ester cyclase
LRTLVAEDEKVAWRWTFCGTHLGEFMGIPATDKQVRLNGTVISRIADDKVAEEWEIFDAAGMLRELGQK